jgi:hypothetical protein
MKDAKENGRAAGESGTCSNEGCGRLAAATYCEACELEWSLFHREARTRPKRDSGAVARGENAFAPER